MTPTQQAVINELRDAGYCVVIWTPEELGNAHAEYLEEIVIERGNNFLDYFAETAG